MSTAIVDLTTIGPDSDGVVRYRGNNRGASLLADPAPERSCVRESGQVAYPVAHRYRMRTTGVLVADTQEPPGAPQPDTVVYMSFTCQGAVTYGCNDDLPGTTASLASRLVSNSLLQAGAEVFVVVAVHPGFNDAGVQGEYSLNLTEARVVGAGTRCDTTAVCGPGSVCVTALFGSVSGVCTPFGSLRTPCRVSAEGAPCEDGLRCSVTAPTLANRGHCFRYAPLGAPCNYYGTFCADGRRCVLNPGSDTEGTCVEAGNLGGTCRSAPKSECEPGLSCIGNGHCHQQATAGQPCDPDYQRVLCPPAYTCAPGTMAGTYACQANGSAPGTYCAALQPGCVAGLDCIEGSCLAAVPAGGACTLRYPSTRCIDAERCWPGARRSTHGTCRAPVREREPNDDPAMARPIVTESTVFSGSLASATDVDCYAVTVPASASLRVSTFGPGYACGLAGGTTVRVYGPGDATLVATNDLWRAGTLCAEIEGIAAGPLHAMRAGTYAVCVSARQPAMAVPNYDLTVEVMTP